MQSQSGDIFFLYFQLSFHQKLSNSQRLKFNSVKLVHEGVQYMFTVHVHTAKYAHYKALRRCGLCLGLDDTNRGMKTNDTSETVNREVSYPYT